MSPRTGRPTNNPKSQSIHIRLDKSSIEILSLYMKQEGTTRAESVRRGIAKLAEEIKNTENGGRRLMNRSERIDEMLNQMNEDVGVIENKQDWLQRMKILRMAATVLAFGDDEAAQSMDKFIAMLKEAIDAKEGVEATDK